MLGNINQVTLVFLKYPPVIVQATHFHLMKYQVTCFFAGKYHATFFYVPFHEEEVVDAFLINPIEDEKI